LAGPDFVFPVLCEFVSNNHSVRGKDAKGWEHAYMDTSQTENARLHWDRGEPHPLCPGSPCFRGNDLVLPAPRQPPPTPHLCLLLPLIPLDAAAYLARRLPGVLELFDVQIDLLSLREEIRLDTCILVPTDLVQTDLVLDFTVQVLKFLLYLFDRVCGSGYRLTIRPPETVVS
jgi:hypothetical protein